MKRIILGTLAFVFTSLMVQATSHFAVNADHYASVPFMRQNPILALGILTMIFQGAVLSYLYGFYAAGQSTLKKGLLYGILMGIFLVSYIALVEPSKYQTPSFISWMAVEGIAGFIQFALFGILLGFIFQRG